MKQIEYGIPVFDNKDKADLKDYSEKMAEAIKTQVDKFGNPLTFKGTVSTLEELQSIEDAINGDIYAVTQDNKNYIFNGIEWIVYSIIAKTEEINDFVISPTEPTDSNRKKVWFRKGKNLFNKEDAIDYDSYVNPAIYIKNDNDIYEEFMKKEESEINIVTGQEIATAECINGKQVFIKELETGNLGNSTYIYVPTGLTNVNYIKCEGRVFNGSITFMLPHIGSSEQENIALFINGDIVNIKTGTNRTTFSGNVRVYYTKN